jgi:hypothetical protein
MHCPRCGGEIADGVRFCSRCGTAYTSQPTVKHPPGRLKWRWWMLAGLGILATVLLIVFSSSTVLPDVAGSMKLDGGTERIKNTKDEYAPLVRQFGYPDSILSTENDTGPDKPLVPTRIARYDTAHLKIALVPIGCVDAYIKAADVLQYPALAREEMERMRAHPCTASTLGWTIMWYIDSSDNEAMSADLAGIGLGHLKEKRTTEPTPKTEVSYSPPEEIVLTATASRDGSNGTVVSGATNLPDGTKLGVELMSGTMVTAQDYSVFVESGLFHSGGFRKGTSPISPGRQRVHIFTRFNPQWQTKAILTLVGSGGNRLKSSKVIRSEDAQLLDADKVLEFSEDLMVPSLRGPAVESPKASQSESRSGATRSIEIVKKAVLVVDGSRSSMNVQDGANFYFSVPGTRKGDGWSSTPLGKDTFNVVLDFVNSDGKGKEWHDKAMWEVDLVTGNVLYRTKYAKDFSWIPAK